MSVGSKIVQSGSVSVIVPTYNRANYLGPALESILAQTFAPAEIIVVDDGSKDNTPEIVAQFSTGIKYIGKPNGGKSSALNLGLRHVTGEFIWIFDDDDLAEPDALMKMVNALREHPECGFAYGDYDLFVTNEAGEMQITPVSFPAASSEDLYLALLERSFIFHPGLLVRKNCYEAVGDFDESLIRSQDFEMMLRLARRYRSVKIEGIAFHQRQHAGLRGSEASPVSADRVVEGWAKHDRKILGQIYTTQDLADYLPKALQRTQLTSEQEFTALLQRCCIVARKGLWSEAARDLRQAQLIAERTGKDKLSKYEAEILGRVFDLFSYAPHTFANASEFRYALSRIKPASLQRQMRAAIIWSLPFTIGAALIHRHYRNFWRFLRVYFALATPSAVLRTVFSRSFFRAGLQLVRARRRGITGRATSPRLAVPIRAA